MPAHIEIDKQKLANFCKSNHIRLLGLFGSVLRDDFAAESDVDVLVEFEVDHVPGLFGMARLENLLTQLIGRKVDLRTAEDLSRYFRAEVVANIEVQYAA